MHATLYMEDDDGNKWFGTNEGYVLKGWRHSFRLEPITIGLPFDHVTTAYHDQGGNWWFADSHFKRTGRLSAFDSFFHTNNTPFITQWHEADNQWTYYTPAESIHIEHTDINAILRVGLKIPGLSSVFKGKLKAAAGFSNVKFAISGAAPINPDILSLFQDLGIPLYEGYGMTENTAGATLNYMGNNKIGSVGKAIPDTRVELAGDGEVLLKGDHVMKGYYRNDQATAETIIDGWLHTGDVCKIDSDGYLSITGRKKEIYVSSAGKNIAPLVIEETMKSIPVISQCFLVGDARKYCSALFTLDVGAILRDKVGLEPNSIPKDPAAQLAVL